MTLLRNTMMRRRNGAKGAVMVEFALSFLLFLIVCIGVFEMSRAMWIYTTLSHAARQGARYAIVSGANAPTPATDASILAVVRKHSIGLVSSDIQADVVWEDATTKDGGEFVRVRARYPMRFITGPVFIGGDGGIQLGSVSQMTISY